MKKTIEIFCCYAYRDQSLLLELKKHLSLLIQQGSISLWTDTDISPGTLHETEINKHINIARIILLLVSPAFLASEYCYSKEMRRAMERQERGEARVIPIILRPIDLEDAPFSKLKHLPENGKPITAWRNRDKAFESVAKGIRKIIKSAHNKILEDLLEGKSFNELTQQKFVIEIIDEIPSLMNSGRCEEALELCELLLHNSHIQDYVYFYKGRILLDMKRYEEALQAFEYTIHLVPNHSFAYQGQICALQAMQSHEEALTACDQAIKACPSFSPLYSLKAQILSRFGRYKEVIETCNDWLCSDFTDSDAYTMKCLALISLGSYQEALDVCEYLQSDNLHKHVLKILILDEMGNHQKAVEHYQELADVDVSLIMEAGPYIAKVLEGLGRYEDAIRVCNHAIRQYPDDVEAYRIKLLCLLSLQQYHEALEVCDHLNRLWPHMGEVFEYQATILVALGRYPEALTACEQAIHLDSTITAHSLRSVCLQRMGRIERH